MIKTIVPGLLLALNVAPAALAADAKPAAGPDKLICRTQDETGSRRNSTKVCMTRAQWEANRRDARDSVARMQAQQVNPCGSSHTTC